MDSKEQLINGMSKLWPNEVIEIRAMWKSGNYSQTEIAKKYGVRSQAISKIISGQRWAWVDSTFISGAA